MSFLKKNYRMAHEFFRKYLRGRFLIAWAVFLLLNVGAYAVMAANMDAAQQIMAQFAEMLEGMNIDFENGGRTALMLLLNNGRSTLSSMLMGLIPYAFLPALTLLVNGVVIGAVLAVAASAGRPAGGLVLYGLLPHGVFEISALMIGVAGGLWLCADITALVRRRDGAMPLERALPALLRVFLCYALPLLIIAALTEAFVTPALTTRFLG